MEREALRRLNFLIETPFDTSKEDLYWLHEALREFPYFQPLRMLYLMGLDTFDPDYQRTFKQAAIYCANRSLLFSYISKKETHTEIKQISAKERKDSSIHRSSGSINHALNAISLSEISPKISSRNQYTFCDWLKIANVQTLEKASANGKHDRAEKLKVIEKFFRNYRGPNASGNTGDIVHTNQYSIVENENLMTETLAQIYVQQKKHTKAIKAYKILSLKYPEKSGSFADQIGAIKKEMENH